MLGTSVGSLLGRSCSSRCSLSMFSEGEWDILIIDWNIIIYYFRVELFLVLACWGDG